MSMTENTTKTDGAADKSSANKNGERPFCPLCEEVQFSCRKDLIDHLIINHPMRGPRYELGYLAENFMAPHKCFCGLSFAFQMDLVQHLKEVGNLFEHWLCASMGVRDG